MKVTEYTTSSGSVLKLRAVPSMAVVAIQRMHPEPVVPTFMNEGKGRMEENPSDPAYLRAVEDHKEKLAMIVNDAYLLNGIEVISIGPDNFELEGEEWAEGLKYVGLDVPDSGIGRKAAWLRWHIVGDADFAVVIQSIAQASGIVVETDVKDAADSFRSNTDGDAHTVIPFTQPS